jgi:hypothetical protein
VTRSLKLLRAAFKKYLQRHSNLAVAECREPM